jgi:beta-galactosidase
MQISRPAPGVGALAPRARLTTDAPQQSLAGTWRFRLSPTLHAAPDDWRDDDTSAWDEIRVPGHWVLQGHGAPAYSNVQMPFPVDPPHPPQANPIGDHILDFVADDAVLSHAEQIIRFDGIESAGEIWLNGTWLGSTRGSRLTHEFDVTGVLHPGENRLAVRVAQFSDATYLENQDMWWLPGIFRDVELIERPAGAIDDHFVHADYDHLSGIGTLRVDASCEAVVEIPELGIRIPAGETWSGPVDPWSAESPRLYRGTLRSADPGTDVPGEAASGGEDAGSASAADGVPSTSSPVLAASCGETISLAVGFRRVSIDDDVFRVNGRPVKLRGVNRHEHDADRGRTLSLDDMRRDIELMKRANVDAVRTAHYPPHPEFLRLCDEYGLWVLLENDLETHGFIYEGWENNPPALPEWRDAIMDRMRRTLERDKNHPSIVIWSMANESMTGDGFAELRSYIDERDGSRPVIYERDPSYRDSDFYSVMYPSLEVLEQIGRREEPGSRKVGMHGMEFDDDASDGHDPVDERRRGLPFLLIEYAHAMGNGPGSLSDYWEIMAKHDRICGGFVWEWIDHGFRGPEGGFLHGADIDYEPNGGRFNLDGLLFSDRTPSPAIRELAKAYAPIGISVSASSITVTNTRHARATDDLVFQWAWTAGVRVVASGTFDLVIEAGSSVVVEAPAAPPGEDLVLTVEAVLAADELWAPAGHAVAWGQYVVPVCGSGRRTPVREDTSGGVDPSEGDFSFRRGEAASAAGSSEPGFGTRTPVRDDASGGADPSEEGLSFGSDARIRMGDALFEGGRLTSFAGMDIAGPTLDLHRAPTENDHGQGGNNNLAKMWQQVGQNRPIDRVSSVEIEGEVLIVHGRMGAATRNHAAEWEMRWRAAGDGIELTTTVDFVGPWADTPYQHHDVWIPRIGLLFSLGSAREARWFGRGPDETYADSRRGARMGEWTMSRPAGSRSAVCESRATSISPPADGPRSTSNAPPIAANCATAAGCGSTSTTRRWASARPRSAPRSPRSTA